MRGSRVALREEIIRAAAVCFGEVGYRATTLDTVAARAGVSKVTLYKHVRSKEELLCQVFERTIRAVREGLGRITAERRPADETLRRIIRYQVTTITTHLPFLTVFFSEESGLPGPMAALVAREKREYDRTIERVVRRGIAEGRLRPLPPTLVVFALLGLCNWLHKGYRPGGRLAPDDIADVFVDLLERGYLSRPPERGGDALAEALGRIETRLGGIERRLPAAPGKRRAHRSHRRPRARGGPAPPD